MERYTFSSPRIQSHQLPSFMINYIPQNWSSSVYQKLTLTCKQFYGTHRILCFPEININPSSDIHGSQVLRLNRILGINKPRFSTSSRIWLSESLIAVNNKECLSRLCGIIYKSTITKLDLIKIQVSCNDLIKLTGNLKNLELDYVTITDSNDQKLSLGDIIAKIPTLEKLSVADEVLDFQLSSTKSIPTLINLKEFHIFKGTVDVNDYCEFIKNHKSGTFSYLVMNTDTVQQLQEILKSTFPIGSLYSLEGNIWFFKVNDIVIKLFYWYYFVD